MKAVAMRDALKGMMDRGDLKDRYFDTYNKDVCEWNEEQGAFVHPDGFVTCAFTIRDDQKKPRRKRRFRVAPVVQLDLPCLAGVLA